MAGNARRDGDRKATVSGAPLYILMSLASGDKHGHALMKDIQRFAAVRLGPGTLYKAIGRLESDGFVAALAPDDRRRPYALTPDGRMLLVSSVEYLGGVVDEARARVRFLPIGPSAAAGVGPSG